MALDSPHCLLLVEDDALVRDTVAMMLQEEGFTVIEAASAAEAIRLVGDGLEVRVMVTDVDLGGGPSGTELADRLHRIRPDLRVIFITGRAGSLAHRARDEREAVLAKPFECADLSRLIQLMSISR
jgi:CheY-like chemotaxis protein